jgi:hypothetical protein
MSQGLDALLGLSAAERDALLAALDDAALIALASPRSEKPVRTRRKALAVIAAEAEMYATFATAGIH